MLPSVFILRPSGKKWGGKTSPTLLTTPKIILVPGKFICMTMGTSLGEIVSYLLFWELIFWSWQKFFSSEKNRSMFGSSGFQFVDQLLDMLQLLILHCLWQKVSLSHHIWNIVHGLPTRGMSFSSMPFSLAMACNDLPGSLSMIFWASVTNSSVLTK